MFTDKELDAVIIRHFINDPVNAINLDAHAHDAMDRRLAWGIEAKPVGNEVRVMRLCSVADPDII